MFIDGFGLESSGVDLRSLTDFVDGSFLRHQLTTKFQLNRAKESRT